MALRESEKTPARGFGAGPASLLLSTDPQQLISIGRLVTSLFAVVAIFLDPTKPTYLRSETRGILAFYVLFSLVLALLPLRQRIDGRVHLLTHGVDLVVLCGLALMTDELNSPFFAFLPFVLLVTTMRWGLQGAIVGAIAVEAVLLLVGWPDLEDGESELNVLITRSAYFLVAAIMLGYFGASRDVSRHRLERLAAWPLSLVSADMKAALETLMEHAAKVLGKPQLVVLWQEQDSPSGTIAVWCQGELQLVEIADHTLWVSLDEAGFLHRPAGAIVSKHRLAGLLEGLAHVPGLQLRLARGAKHAYSAHFSGICSYGELFVLNPTCYQEEGPSLTAIIAARIASELERLALLRDISRSARFEERTRLARDLHDSVLQDLTAASLRLKLTMAHAPEELKPDLGVVSGLMLDQQQRIRHYVEHVQAPSVPNECSLLPTLRDCAATLRRRWNCDITITIEPPQLKLRQALALEISQLLSEATANAVRHGEATHLELVAKLQQTSLELRITDNGKGMVPKAQHASMAPASLTARVADLRGELTITGVAAGLTILISLPV